MNNQQFQTHWTNLQPKIKQKWSKFTDQDFKQINGQKDKFITLIQQKYGINQIQADKELLELSKAVVGIATTASKPAASVSATPTKGPSSTAQPKKK